MDFRLTLAGAVKEPICDGATFSTMSDAYILSAVSVALLYSWGGILCAYRPRESWPAIAIRGSLSRLHGGGACNFIPLSVDYRVKIGG
jgi:hypothetical protein